MHVQQGRKTDTPSLTTTTIASLTSRRNLQEIEARAARVDALKAQVESGTYQVDGAALADHMLSSSLAQKMLGLDHRRKTRVQTED